MLGKLSRVINVGKALGLTVATLSVSAVGKVKTGIATSRDIYSECKARVDESSAKQDTDKCSCHTLAHSCKVHDPNGYYVGYTAEDEKRDNIKAGIGYRE